MSTLALTIGGLAFTGALGAMAHNDEPLSRDDFQFTVNGEPMRITTEPGRAIRVPAPDSLTFPEWDELPLDFMAWEFPFGRPYDHELDGL